MFKLVALALLFNTEVNQENFEQIRPYYQNILVPFLVQEEIISQPKEMDLFIHFFNFEHELIVCRSYYLASTNFPSLNDRYLFWPNPVADKEFHKNEIYFLEQMQKFHKQQNELFFRNTDHKKIIKYCNTRIELLEEIMSLSKHYYYYGNTYFTPFWHRHALQTIRRIIGEDNYNRGYIPQLGEKLK